MSMSYKELQKISDDQLVNLYDEQAQHTCVGINYYADELNRRQSERANKVMVRCTVAITIMTAVMLLATIVNVIVVFMR